MTFSRCGYPPDDNSDTGLKVIVYDTPIQGRKTSVGGIIRINETEDLTTQNIVLKEMFK